MKERKKGKEIHMHREKLQRIEVEDIMPQDIIIQTFEKCAAGVDMHSADGANSPEVRGMVEEMLYELRENQLEMQYTPYIMQCIKGVAEIKPPLINATPDEILEVILKEWNTMSAWSVVFRLLFALREQMIKSYF